MSTQQSTSESEPSSQATDEQEKLENELRHMITEVNLIKQELYSICNKLTNKEMEKTQFLFAKTKQELKSTTSTGALELFFYETFMKITISEDMTLLNVTYNTPIENYSLSFAHDENSNFNLERAYLPVVLNNREQKETLKSVPPENLSRSIRTVQEYIYAASLRKEQILDLQNSKKNIRLFHTACGCNVEIHFNMFIVDKEEYHKGVLKMKYNPLHVRPSHSEFDLKGKTKKYLESISHKLKLFKKMPLLEAFEAVFENEDDIQFLI